MTPYGGFSPYTKQESTHGKEGYYETPIPKEPGGLKFWGAIEHRGFPSLFMNRDTIYACTTQT